MIWQDIATFQKANPNSVLLYWPYWSTEPVIGQYVGSTWWTERWLGDDEMDPGPTHWMPLPEKP